MRWAPEGAAAARGPPELNGMMCGPPRRVLATCTGVAGVATAGETAAPHSTASNTSDERPIRFIPTPFLVARVGQWPPAAAVAYRSVWVRHLPRGSTPFARSGSLDVLASLPTSLVHLHPPADHPAP